MGLHYNTSQGHDLCNNIHKLEASVLAVCSLARSQATPTFSMLHTDDVRVTLKTWERPGNEAKPFVGM